MPLILPGNVASATAAVGYDVANSCRFNDGDTAYMHKTMGTPTNVDIFTWSAWVKRGVSTDATMHLFSFEADGNNREFIMLNASQNNDTFEYKTKVSGTETKFVTNARFRDPTAWYHFVVAVDTTQSTDTNRVKIYVNGTQATSFSTGTYIAQNTDTILNLSGSKPALAANWDGSTPEGHFDGYMAEVCFIDGTQYAASDFGEFDEDSPTIWKPKDPSGLTFGDNGFYLDFEASGNLGNDVNGGTDLTEVNLAATDQTADTPTNNFCTWNPVGNPRIDSGSLIEPDYSEGNTTVTHDNSSNVQATTTFFVNKGKWYMECECDAIGSGNTATLGILEDTDFGEAGETHVYRNNGNYVSGSYGDTFTSGDIISMAFDATNGTVWFAKNGTWQNSATEGEIEAGTTTNAAEASLDMTISWTIMTKGLSDNIMKANFGTAYADTVSSGNADGDGYGNFEYAVPDGFYALCTKNLAEYG